MDRSPPLPLTTIGPPVPCGAYLLHIAITETMQCSVGCLHQGRPLRFQAGDYLYVGSAMGVRGSATLGRRLMRHAMRTPGRPPQPLCDRLHSALVQQGLASLNAAPSSQKHLRWHIDYLLDRPEANLVHLYALRSSQRHEEDLARLVLAEADVQSFLPGFGASDVRSESHLFMLPAGQQLTSRLPDLMRTLCG